MSPCPAKRPTSSRASRFKLYLNSFSNTPLRIVRRGARAHAHRREPKPPGAAHPCGPASACSSSCPTMFDREPVHELDGLNLDRLDIECTHYTPAPELLSGGVRASSRCNETLDQQPAQEQLPGHRPARLGQRADPLQRPADRPGRAAALPGELSQPQRIPRAVRRAHLHGHLERAASRPSSRCMRATRGAAGWTSTRSAPASRRRCRRTSARRGSRPQRAAAEAPLRKPQTRSHRACGILKFAREPAGERTFGAQTHG